MDRRLNVGLGSKRRTKSRSQRTVLSVPILSTHQHIGPPRLSLRPAQFSCGLDRLHGTVQGQRQESIRSPTQHKVYGTIFWTLHRRSLTLVPRCILGIYYMEWLADALSRFQTIASEWSRTVVISVSYFVGGGTFQVEMMASPFNAQLICFVKPFLHPRVTARGVDL